MNLFRQSLSLVMYDFLNDISETRTSCGFRENMIQEANRPATKSHWNGLFAAFLNL